MNKTEYIIALLQHCKKIGLALAQDSHNILFFMYHVDISLSAAKDHLTAYRDHMKQGN